MSTKLVDFYRTGVSMPQLNEGVYTCTLVSHKLVETNPENPYIALEFKTKEGRLLRDNRFNQGFQIFISHLKQQLNRGDEEITVLKFLDELITNKTEFKIWITKYTPANGGQTRSNFNFLEPRKREDTDIKIKPISEDEVKDDL